MFCQAIYNPQAELILKAFSSSNNLILFWVNKIDLKQTILNFFFYFDLFISLKIIMCFISLSLDLEILDDAILNQIKRETCKICIKRTLQKKNSPHSWDTQKEENINFLIISSIK